MFELPDITDRITKEFLLSKHSEETYMSTYLGLPIKKGLQISPLRKDRRPTVSFYRNKNGDLIYHDFGNGFHGNFITVVMEIYQCDYSKALRIIGKDFGFISSTKTEKKKIIISDIVYEEKTETTLSIEYQPFSKSELDWWNTYGITENILKKFKVYSCKNVFLNNFYFTSSSTTNPIYGYYFGKRNYNEIWKIYFPKKYNYRFLSNCNKQLIQGSKQLPNYGDLLVITKSLKDVMCLYNYNIPSIAPGSETSFISDNQLSRLKQRFEKIIVFYDNDIPGISGMRKIKKSHPELIYYFLPRKYNVKDFTDFRKKYGDTKTKNLIDNELNKLQNEVVKN